MGYGLNGTDVTERKTDVLDECFAANRAWAASSLREDPQFFERLVALQSPDLLWIGCSDSRIPANTIIGRKPGELFVHRNVANLVVHTDLNCLSVLQFAIDVLKIKHVIVCGHYGCGGIRAALEKDQHGLIDNWLRHVQDVARAHEVKLDAMPDFDSKVDKLCELNVIDQVQNVARTTIVQDAWRRGDRVELHGWIYGLKDGLITDLGLQISK